MSLRPATQWALLVLIFLAALAIRVVPAWDAVYGGDGVNLQGGDSYYHVRSIHALAANFPWRPGYDPYALYPKGLNVPTGPLFDYAAASLALALGAGDPSPELVEHVAAWIPPLFGALVVVPVFLVGRGLLGPWAGLIGAAWAAVCSGHVVVYSKLGFADHHIFEMLLYAAALYALARAVGSDAVERRYAALAGLAIGCALLNRPAAAFLGALFGVWAAFQAGLDLWQGRNVAPAARAMLIALPIAWLFLAVAGSGAWGLLPHIAMAGGIGAALTGWALASTIRNKGLPFWVWPLTAGLLGVVGILAAGWISPFTMHVLIEGFTEALAGGESRLVAEVRSLLRVGGRWSLRPLLVELGPAGLLAAPAFAVMAWEGVRKQSRALLLVAATGLAAYVLALLQARMAIYGAVNLAVAVGWCVWRLLEGRPRMSQWLRGVAAAVVLFLPVAFSAANLSARPMGMSAAWRSAMQWMRAHTPDPLGDPAAFHRYYPRLERDARFDYPPGAYGVMTWWDNGYWVLLRGRRPPIANGTQTGARQAASFYVSTEPERALAEADALGVRYVIADHTTAATPLAEAGPGNSQFRAMAGWTATPLDRYMAAYELPLDGGGNIPVLVFFPAYYRSMAARLYLHDGQAYEPRNATTVFALRDGDGPLQRISSRQTFETFERAQRYVDARPDQSLIVGSLDPYRSCAPLEAVSGLRLVFDSGDGAPVGGLETGRAVKIFERVAASATGTPADLAGSGEE